MVSGYLTKSLAGFSCSVVSFGSWHYGYDSYRTYKGSRHVLIRGDWLLDLGGIST